MRIHYLQHVAFEDLAAIGNWAEEKGYPLSVTKFFQQDVAFPMMEEFDWLIVMGGPMNIYEEKEYPWLVREKQFIKAAVEQGKTVLGVCLGAQLIADVLGGRVYRNKNKEIGWFPIEATGAGRDFGFPAAFPAFHWHGDTFELPPGSLRLAQSKACANQAFLYQERVLGLQFHLESTPLSVEKLIQHCGEELVDGEYIQKPQFMLAQSGYFAEIDGLLRRLLDKMAQAEKP